MGPVPTIRRNLSQPKDWWEAFQSQAKKEAMTLSEWIAECCKANLDDSVASNLSERRPANRPPSS